MSSEKHTKVGIRVVPTPTTGHAVSAPPPLVARVEIAKVIDYRNSAMRITDRAHTAKSNFLAIGIAIAVTLGLLVYTVSGY